MTDPIPSLPALQHMNAEAAMFIALAQFQAVACQQPPVPPRLPQVLAAALPAFQAGFSYTSSFWNGELCVTLHHGGAELGSSSAAPIDNYTETAAQLLAGLLGIPLADGLTSDADLLEAIAPAVVHPIAAVAPAAVEPEPIDSPAQEPATDESEQAEQPPADATAPIDVRRPLSERERESAVGMVKCMPVDVRKAFSRAFREVFEVPAEAKQLVPFIQELRHMQFIDRFTVEAAGGVAA